jgi:hypothetical protein
MSQFKVKSPDVFSELASAISTPCQKSPNLVNSFIHLVEQFRDNLYTDLKETQTQAEQRSNEKKEASGNLEEEQSAQHDVNNFQQKESALKSAISQTDHLLMRLKGTQSRAFSMSSASTKGIQALNEFEKIARVYLKGGNSSSSDRTSQFDRNGSSGEKSFSGIKQVGDSYHFDLDRTTQINQHTLDSLMYKAKQLNQGANKANKVSIGNVSQSSFTMLEKNGFTIQKIGANDYSAFKEI